MNSTLSQALVPNLVVESDRKVLSELISWAFGIALISLLAQVSIVLPWTPVPITGQTLGVTLVALSWGRKRALAVIFAYLAMGSLGLPIFALGKSGFAIGPTMGYLLGMVLSSYVVGALADRGYTKTFGSALAVAFVGSALVLGTGVFVLSYFIPKESLLIAGLLPFLPGDLVKNLIAAATTAGVRRMVS